MSNFNLHRTACLFATAHALAEGGDPRSPEAVAAGTITIDATAAWLQVSRDDAIAALVALRTCLHNSFVAPRAGTADPTADASSFGSVSALKAEAAALLARQLDDLDEVFLRLDLRVAEAMPVAVSLDDGAERDRLAVLLAHSMTPHEAAWYAVRPEDFDGRLHRQRERLASVDTLLLGAFGGSCNGDLFAATAASTPRGSRRFARRTPTLALARVDGTSKLSCAVDLDEPAGDAAATPGAPSRHRSAPRRDGGAPQRQ
jgi:hypothetical protein